MTTQTLSDQASAIVAITREIGPDIIAATASADLAVIQQARTIAAFVEEHAARKLPLHVGLEALFLSGKAVASAIQAREDSLMARLAFFKAAKTAAPEIAFGPFCPCDPPHSPSPSAGLVAGSVAQPT